MIMRVGPGSPGLGALVLFRPQPHVFYGIDATALLAGVTRRSILMYCRSGLLTPRFQPPFGVMVFDEEAIKVVRRIERVRVAHGFDHAWLAAMLDAIEELEGLRADLHALRASTAPVGGAPA